MNVSNDRPARAWQRMLSGRRLDLLRPSPEDIEIEDIARGLARVARWNGQTSGPYAYSVAQHALIVEEITQSLNPNWSNQNRLASLLHDAAEYVIGDLISPFKAVIGLDYKEIELRLLSAIYDRFLIDQPLAEHVAKSIKDADQVAAYFEATCLAGFELEEAEMYFGKPPWLPVHLAAKLRGLKPVPATEAEVHFIERFTLLQSTS